MKSVVFVVFIASFSFSALAAEIGPACWMSKSINGTGEGGTAINFSDAYAGSYNSQSDNNARTEMPDGTLAVAEIKATPDRTSGWSKAVGFMAYTITIKVFEKNAQGSHSLKSSSTTAGTVSPEPKDSLTMAIPVGTQPAYGNVVTVSCGIIKKPVKADKPN